MLAQGERGDDIPKTASRTSTYLMLLLPLLPSILT
jgi:hypothetical protein